MLMLDRGLHTDRELTNRRTCLSQPRIFIPAYFLLARLRTLFWVFFTGKPKENQPCFDTTPIFNNTHDMADPARHPNLCIWGLERILFEGPKFIRSLCVGWTFGCGRLPFGRFPFLVVNHVEPPNRGLKIKLVAAMCGRNLSRSSRVFPFNRGPLF